MPSRRRTVALSYLCIVIWSIASSAQEREGAGATSVSSAPSGAQVAADQTRNRIGVDGTIYLGASELDPTGREADSSAVGVGFDFAGFLTNQVRLKLSFVRGPADLVSSLTIPGYFRATAQGVLQHPHWTLTAGDFASANHALAGPVVRADGVSLSLKRRLVAEIAVGRPKYLAGQSGGHLFQAKVGINTAVGTVAVVGSDLSRPLAFSPIVGVAATAPQAEPTVEELDALRRLLSRESAVRGLGVESDFRFGRRSTLLIRAGELSLSNHAGLTSHGAAGEARYTLTGSRGSLHAYARRAPASLIGTYVPGDALALDGSARVIGTMNATAHVYSNSNWLIGEAHPVRSDGASVGINRLSGPTHFTIQLNDRHLAASDHRWDLATYTVSASMTRTLGMTQFDGGIETGIARGQAARRAVQLYRARLTVGSDTPASVWLAASYSDYAIQPPRMRADVGLSGLIGAWELEGGAGFGSGQILGNVATAWGSIAAPIMYGLTVVANVDYTRWDYKASPYIRLLVAEPSSPWRISLGIRRRLTLRKRPSDPLWSESRNGSSPLP